MAILTFSGSFIFFSPSLQFILVSISFLLLLISSVLISKNPFGHITFTTFFLLSFLSSLLQDSLAMFDIPCLLSFLLSLPIIQGLRVSICLN